MPRFIRAIKDVHTDPAGRMRAQRLLLSRDIRVFFIEWAIPVVPPLDKCFERLNPCDAHPTLRELADICTAQGIAIVACDLSPEETVRRLNANEADSYAGTYKEGSAVQPWGKAVRDRHAARTIGDYMNSHPDDWNHALLMFGADHFKHEDGRNAPVLHALIELQFADGNVTFIK